MEKKAKSGQPVQKQEGLASGGKGKSMSPPPFQLKAEGEPVQMKLANEDLVVRGGLSAPETLITNQGDDSRGHISANAANGASMEQLATSPKPFLNGSLTVSTVGKIRGIKNAKGKAMDVLEDPTKGNPLHASIEPHTTLGPEDATTLSQAFDAVPNEWKSKK